METDTKISFRLILIASWIDSTTAQMVGQFEYVLEYGHNSHWFIINKCNMHIIID